MKSNYMMSAEDVANELGISKGHAYKVIRQLNEELEKSGFIIVGRSNLIHFLIFKIRKNMSFYHVSFILD